MSEIVLELGVRGPTQEAAFVQALDCFARWREETCGTNWMDRDAPDFMVRTVCGRDGQLNKAIIFQESQWADMFMKFWRTENHSAA